MICPYPGCGEDAKPLRGQERVTHRPAWMCRFCGGRLPRPSERDRKNNNRRSER